MNFNTNPIFAFSENSYTINTSVSAIAGSTFFLLFCFNSTIYTNISSGTDFELGNIELFLSNDSFYPQSGIGTRYSFIQPNDYVFENSTNCVKSKTASGNTNTTTIIGSIRDSGKPWVAIIDEQGKVRGPKSGIVCENTTKASRTNNLITKFNKTELNSFLTTIRERWNSKNISAGLVETMVVDTLIYRTNCVDEERVKALNATIYNKLGPDPRNKLDATRKTGLFPKCSSSGCFNNKFISKSTGNNYFLHDQIFRTNLVLQLADDVYNQIPDGC